MPLTDSQLVGLIDLLLLQQKEILELKAWSYSLAKLARDMGGDEIGKKFLEYRDDQRKHASIHGSDAILEELEKVVLQLRHAGNPMN